MKPALNRPDALTFKQLDALYWIVTLKGFQAAADKLHTSQSAISKRIKDLEGLFGVQVFNRSSHAARLTADGQDLFRMAENLLSARQQSLAHWQDSASERRRLRFGCTEFAVMTWLPKFMLELRILYPGLTPEPQVDTSGNIARRLRADELDLAFVPEQLTDDSTEQLALCSIQLAWASRRGMFEPGRTLSLAELHRQTLLMQRSEDASTVRTYQRWLSERSIPLGHIIACTSMQGIVGMAVAGVGVGYLPPQCLGKQVGSGELELLCIDEALPSTRLVATYRRSEDSSFLAEISRLARDCASAAT